MTFVALSDRIDLVNISVRSVGECDMAQRGPMIRRFRVWLRSSGFFETHRANELVEIVDDALVEPVELGLL
jgi:hypothetical protein